MMRHPHRSGAAALPGVLAVLGLLVAAPAHAQDAPDVGDDGGVVTQGSWLDQMHPAKWFDRTRDAFFEALLRVFTDPERGLPALLGRWVQDTLRTVWGALWDLFAPFRPVQRLLPDPDLDRRPVLRRDGVGRPAARRRRRARPGRRGHAGAVDAVDP